MRKALILSLLVLAAPGLRAACPALSPGAITILKPLMVLRNKQAADQFTPDGRWRGESPVTPEVEKRFYAVLANHSPAGDQALAYLLTVYMGEHPGEQMVCEATNRGERLLPLILSFSKCQPLVGAEPLHKFVQGNGATVTYALQGIKSGARCDAGEP